jgi:hypothetical protein
MGTRHAAVTYLNGRRSAGPMYRSIVAIDLEGSTLRTNPVKGELRRVMYDLLGRALAAAEISDDYLERLTDRGDGILVLIRPHDDVPKTVLLDRLIPRLTALLIEYNARVTQPALRMRLRTVVHAGEVHGDRRGYYGEAIDIAIRLLDSAPVKKALNQTTSPLVLVISEEIHSGIVLQGYVTGGTYQPIVRVRVANKQRRGWVHVPGSDELRAASSPAKPSARARTPVSIGRAGVTRLNRPMQRRSPVPATVEASIGV